MGKIIIKKNPNGDTRTAPKGVTFEQFHKANIMHIKNVKDILNVLAFEMAVHGEFHDITKKLYEDEFYQDFTKVLNEGGDFTQLDWYKKHVNVEKHHPTSNLHDDFNLLDLIETIVDGVAAGLARSGEVRAPEINDEIIHLAIDNTIEHIKDIIQVEE